MKIIKRVVLIGAGLFVTLNLHAQLSIQSLGTVSAASDSIVQVTAEAHGLSLVAPEDLPPCGTFWEVLPGGIMAPLPCPLLDQNLPTYAITDTAFLVDATGGQVTVNQRQLKNRMLTQSATSDAVTSALAAQTTAIVNLINQVQTAAASQQLRTMAGAMGVPSPGDGGGDSGGGDGTNNYGNYTWDTNQLWLQITNVTHDTTFANLHNATNQVYAIWGTADLATPMNRWNVATELWPTGDQTNVMPFTVQNYGSPYLFLRAEDWTGVDSDGDGIPDWWAWKCFGAVNVTATNLDNYFRPLLYDYQHGQNPNQMGFSQVLAWGDNSFGQCNIPLNLTNAVAVAGNGDAYFIITLEYQYIDGVLTLWPYISDTPTGAFSLALKADGGMVAWGDGRYGQTNIPSNLTNIMAIAAGSCHGLALDFNGNVHAWGSWDSADEYDINVISNSAVVPGGISNVVAIAAGRNHDVALRADGTVLSWGYFTNAAWVLVPTNLPPARDVAAGWNYSAALLANGTVAIWAGNLSAPTSSISWYAPASLTNAIAIAGGPADLLVLKADGNIIDLPGDSENELAQITNAVSMANGYMPGLALDGSGSAWILSDSIASPNYPLSHMIAIAAGWNHALAIRGGLLTPLIAGQPASQFVASGTNLTLGVQALSVVNPSYQWQFDGVNLTGATNAMLTLANVQSFDTGNYGCVVANNFGAVVSSNALITVVTPPVITSQSSPTNIVCIYGNHVALAATATAPGQFNGFPLSYQWQCNGTNISGATSNAYDFYATNSPGNYSLVVANVAGSATASWQVANTNAINVTNDLLLIYNANSTDSSNLCAYYLAHRPLVGGANVLGVACNVSGNEFFTNSTDWDTQLMNPIINWLTNNPTKRPQYVILFYGIPTRLWLLGEYGCGEPWSDGSVSYHLQNSYPNWKPFVTHLNAGSLADCKAYVDKIAAFGSNYSPGKLIISAGLYGNTNYIIDNARHGSGYGPLYGDYDYSSYGSVVSSTTNALIANGVSPGAIIYNDGLDTITTLVTNGITNAIYYYASQIMVATNVAGYICWGEHSALNGNYPSTVNWTNNSSWWIIETIESFNGTRWGCGQGNFIQWFSSNAFGGTNYSNTPIGAVSHTEEPGSPGNSENSSIYFGLWASGKNFAICAWNSRQTKWFQAIGDPFVTK